MASFARARCPEEATRPQRADHSHPQAIQRRAIPFDLREHWLGGLTRSYGLTRGSDDDVRGVMA
jgi:hypothetical protein